MRRAAGAGHGDVQALGRVRCRFHRSAEARPYQGFGLVSREGIENTLEIVREGGRVGPEIRFEDVADGQLAEEVARELGLIR